MLCPITKKYTDESSMKQFRFTFYCDCCGKAIPAQAYDFNSAFAQKTFLSNDEKESRAIIYATFDNELGIRGFCTLRFATETGSHIRPVTKLYGSKISLEEYVPTREGYTFEGWFSDPITKQNQVTEFTFNRNDVVYAKWNKISNEININEIMAKDTCYPTDEETAQR